MTRLPCIWIVEDNNLYRNTVARALERSGKVDCPRQFGNGGLFFDALGSASDGEKPDVVLLDVELPDGSGLELIPVIRDAAPACHVIIVTVFEEENKIIQAICNGAQGYILKSSPLEEIVAAIEQAMAGGAPMTPRIAHCVLRLFSKFAPRQADYGLSPREKETLERMVQGYLRKEIADQLGISLHTVDTYFRGIYRKLEVNTRTGAVAKALKEGIV